MPTTLSLAEECLQYDRSSVWHPYAHKTVQEAILIQKGLGAHLYASDGTRYFDAISSWWVNLHGHAHSHIKETIFRQMEQLEHVAFTDFTHYPAVSLAKKLLHLTGWEKGRVFFSDNGSTAVETALKMAVQYWNNTSHAIRKKIICFQNAYHGDTFGAMSVSGRSYFNLPFWPYLFEVETISPPHPGAEEKSIAQLRSLVGKGEVACFIFEPIIQGAYGMRIHSAEGLNALINICREHHVITIADEVMTGFGRTGPLFACDYLEVAPDIMCLSKGVTGGFLPLGVTICQDFIYEAFYADRAEKAFLHGHSYCANPLACAAGVASMELLEKEECAVQRQLIEKSHFSFQKSWKDHKSLKRCEVIGTILALEYKVDPSYFSQWGRHLKGYLMSHGIFVRPLANVLYLIPPYCSEVKDLEHAYHHIKLTLETEPWNTI